MKRLLLVLFLSACLSENSEPTTMVVYCDGAPTLRIDGVTSHYRSNGGSLTVTTVNGRVTNHSPVCEIRRLEER